MWRVPQQALEEFLLPLHRVAQVGQEARVHRDGMAVRPENACNEIGGVDDWD
jgi:hypothetical protein